MAVSGIMYSPLVIVTGSFELTGKPALEMGLSPSPTSNRDRFMPSVLQNPLS